MTRYLSALAVVLTIPLVLIPHPAAAEDVLRALGESFYTKIGKRLEEAELLLKGTDKLRLAELRSSATIADGEPLLMQGSTAGADGLLLGSSINATRQNGRLMMALSEFCNAVDFPIRVSPSSGIASGWFLREDRTFYLDAAKGQVTVMGKTIPVDPSDISVTEDDIMVSSAQMEKWFGIQIDFDLSSLSYYVASPIPLPVQQRNERGRRQKYAPESQTAKAPFNDIPYKALSMPYFDVSAGISSTKISDETPRTVSATWSAIGAGDLGKLSSKTYISGDKDNAVSTLRQTFGRDSEEGWGDGRTRIRSFSFGDVYTPQIPLINGGTQEQGVFLSSRRPGTATTLNQTDIRGDAQPGWDVELYNNETLVGFQTVGLDGRYNFDSVFLSDENNNLRLVFYGPQGEIYQETRRIVAAANSLALGKGVWDTSLTRANTTTYNAEPSKTPIDGDPQLALRYERSLGGLGSASAGFVHRSETDNVISATKDYIQGGIATSLGEALVTVNTAYDIDGAYMADALARKNFGGHQTGLLFSLSSGDFSQGGLTSFAPKKRAQIFARGPLTPQFMGFKNLAYNLDTARTHNTNDATTTELTSSVSGRYDNITLSSGLRYNTTDFSGAGASSGADNLNGFTVASGFWKQDRWRLSAAYDLDPVRLSSFSGNLTHAMSKELSTITTLTHSLDNNTTGLELSANWRTKKVSVIPYVSADTQHRMATGVNMRFGIAQNPYNGKYRMISSNLSDSGGMAARVFLDRNGDGVYQDGEEPLPEVEVQALQSGRQAQTSRHGIAFSPELPVGIRTDIAVNGNTFPDPYYVTMDEGMSVRPRPGVTAQIDFPVVVSSEMDGTAEYIGAKGKKPARGARISLVTPDGRVEKTAIAAFDGYWSISMIKPGVYYLVGEASPALPGYMIPEIITFKPEGENLFGHNFAFTAGHTTLFKFSSENQPPWGRRRARVITPRDIDGETVSLEVGDFYSQVALTVAWYKLKLRDKEAIKHLSLAAPLSGVTPDPKTRLMHLPLKPDKKMTLAEATDACQTLQALDYSCTVKVLSRFQELTAAK